jgi:hypothetical protein
MFTTIQLRSRIKCPGAQQIQIMHGEGQIAKQGNGVRSFLFSPLETPAHPAKPETQSDALIPIPQFTEQSPNMIGLIPGRADDPRGGVQVSMAGFDRPEKEAFEIPAAGRAVSVNTAGTSLEGRTGLGQTRCSPGVGERDAAGGESFAVLFHANLDIFE